MLGGPGKDLVSINNSKDQDLKGSIPWSDNLRTSTSEPWSKVAASSLAKSGAREGASLVGILRPVSDKSAVAQLRKDLGSFVKQRSFSSTDVKRGMVDQQQTWDPRRQKANTKGRMVGKEFDYKRHECQY
jgi:hypothetical protein